MLARKIVPLLFLPIAACAEDILQEAYQGSPKSSDETVNAPFPLQAGERFVYIWNIKKQGDCQDDRPSEDSLQIAQCSKILAVDESQAEVKVTSWTKFQLYYPSMDEEQFAAYSRTMSPSWFFKMAPDEWGAYFEDPEITYYTQRAPRPYSSGLGADQLDYRALHFIDLRQLDNFWGGWQDPAQSNFRQELSSYFSQNFPSAQAHFQVQTATPTIYQAGYSWREELNGEQLVHAVYYEYNERGVLTHGDEVILFDQGAMTEIPSPVNLISMSCQYPGSIVVNIIDGFSSNDLEYNWAKYCK